MATKKDTPTDISSIIKELQKKYPQSMSTNKVSTGVLPMDYVLNGGFIPPTFIEIAGESGTGKSTLALSVAKSLIRRGQRVLYLNFELATVQASIKSMGMDKLDPSVFLVLTPSSISEGEECIRSTCYITKEGEEPYYNHVFFDSVGGMIPDFVEDKDIDSTDNTPALRARQLSKFFEIHTAKLKRRNINCWFINHLSLKIETTPGKTSTKKSKGGNAVKYYTDTWVYLESGANLHQTSKDNVTGGRYDKDYYANMTTLQTTKGRGGGMLKKTECPLYFGKGVSNAHWLYLVLQNLGYITTSGSYKTCTLLDANAPACLGIPKCINYIRENQKEIIKKLKELNKWIFSEDGEN